jgi:hypothetical protein
LSGSLACFGRCISSRDRWGNFFERRAGCFNGCADVPAVEEVVLAVAWVVPAIARVVLAPEEVSLTVAGTSSTAAWVVWTVEEVCAAVEWVVLTAATSLRNTAKAQKPVENPKKPLNRSLQRRRRGIFVERHPQKDEAPSGAA